MMIITLIPATVGRGVIRCALAAALHLGRRDTAAEGLHVQLVSESGGPCVPDEGALLSRLGRDLHKAGLECALAQAGARVQGRQGGGHREEDRTGERRRRQTGKGPREGQGRFFIVEIEVFCNQC